MPSDLIRTRRCGWIGKEQDETVVAAQLRRPVYPLADIRCRCWRRQPRVVATWPVRQQAGRWEIFPTLFWLSCPRDVQAVGRLEEQGWIGKLQERWQREPGLSRRMRLARDEYIHERLQLITASQQRDLRRSRPALWQVLNQRGIGGSMKEGFVKCLHMHYAHFLATGANPIGSWVSRHVDLKRARCQKCAKAKREQLSNRN